MVRWWRLSKGICIFIVQDFTRLGYMGTIGFIQLHGWLRSCGKSTKCIVSIMKHTKFFFKKKKKIHQKNLTVGIKLQHHSNIDVWWVSEGERILIYCSFYLGQYHDSTP